MSRFRRSAGTATGRRRAGKPLRRYLLGLVLVAVGGLVLAPAAQAAAQSMSPLQLSPTSDTVGGASVTATVTVLDSGGAPVPGENIIISTGAGLPQVAQDPNNTGTYTATLTVSFAAGPVTFTATDTSTPTVQSVSQTLGPPVINLSLQPGVIVADGQSSAVATAIIADSSGIPYSNENVNFSSNNPGETVFGFANNAKGSYSESVRSSFSPGLWTITATDSSGGINSQQPLTEVANSSTTTLSAFPPSATTNEPVTLVAAVTGGAPSGTVTFYNAGVPISGCSGVALTPYATCQTTFSAASSPVQLSATFTPDSTSTSVGSTGTATLSVGPGSTSTSLDLSTAAASVGGSVTYTASVAANGQGPFAPNGSVRFLDGGSPIGSCGSVHLVSMFGVLVANCTVHYSVHGNHSVVAAYGGDRNFAGSQSNTVQLAVLRQSPGTPRLVTSAMEWNFYFTPTFTQFRSLILIGASVGTQVVMTCNGKGCPFAKRTSSVVRGIRCTPGGKHRCGSSRGPINLTPMFHKHRLRVGTRITIEIVRTGWIGKFYAFVFRPSVAPKVRISCLAPGLSRPGVGC